MKKILLTLLGLNLLVAANSQACSDEEFKALDKQITETQKNHLTEKSTQLNIYLQKIKTQKNLSDKELFKYKTSMLNNPEAKKIQAKGPQITYADFFRLMGDKDCKTYKKWADESMVSANKQWDIVFEALEKDLNN